MPQRWVGFDENALAYVNAYEIDYKTLSLQTLFSVAVVPAKSTNGSFLRNVEGGIFDSKGRFIEGSAQLRSDGESAIKANQEPRESVRITDHLDEALYGGIILDHYGHFVLETPARLWALGMVDSNIPVLFIGPLPPQIRSWHYDFLLELGLERSRIHIVDDATTVGRLHLPESSIRYHNWVSERHRAAYQVGTPSVAKKSEKIWLSRSSLSFGCTLGELELEEELGRSGWNILNPECLTAREQIKLFRQSSLLMGIQGSALHTALFAEEGQQLIHICRTQAQRAYYMLDALAGIDAVYFNGSRDIAGYPPFGSSGPFIIDIEKTLAFLRSEDLLDNRQYKSSGVELDSDLKVRLGYIAWWHYTKSLQIKYRVTDPGEETERLCLDSARTASVLMPDVHLFVEHLIVQTRTVAGSSAGLDLAHKASEKSPLHAQYHYLVAYFCDEMQDYESALSSAKVACQLNRSNVLYSNRVALQLYRLEQYEDAKEILMEHLNKNTGDAETHHLLSLIAESRKSITVAVDHAQLAVKLSQAPALMWRHVELLLEQRSLSQAKDTIQVYLTRYPEDSRMIDLLERMKELERNAEMPPEQSTV